jgi:hypothetical protein
MNRAATTFLMTSILLSAACAQDVPPPPKPADDGPSLADTMKFIEDKLTERSRVNFITYVHDNVQGNDWTISRTTELTNLRATPGTCRIDFHWLLKERDKTPQDLDVWFLLKAVREIVVLPLEQRYKTVDAEQGNPGLSTRVDPPVTVVVVKRADGVSHEFDFYDETLANRVAKALVHAVELCGGGSKDPF